jgi:hypothetical protein
LSSSGSDTIARVMTYSSHVEEREFLGTQKPLF